MDYDLAPGGRRWVTSVAADPAFPNNANELWNRASSEYRHVMGVVGSSSFGSLNWATRCMYNAYAINPSWIRKPDPDERKPAQI
jgi:hypothetical protein